MVFKQQMLTHCCVIAVIAAGTGVGYVYINPYAVHQIHIVSYDEFDTVPFDNESVSIQQSRINFRLPAFSLSVSTIESLPEVIGSDDSSDHSLVTRCICLVREKLNGTDSSQPRPDSTSAEKLFHRGQEFYCLCGEHALVLNEILQSFGVLSRVLWLEGHVATEYFDRRLNQWVFVDPHLNSLFTNAAGEKLSVSRLIQTLERDQQVHRQPVCRNCQEDGVPPGAEVDMLWYRNVLLNGECCALSGTTLCSSSQWSHLFRYHQRPQMLMLASQYDSSGTRFVEHFQWRKYLLLVIAALASVYLLAFVLIGPRSATTGKP